MSPEEINKLKWKQIEIVALASIDMNDICHPSESSKSKR
jgi:hypothetical protein